MGPRLLHLAFFLLAICARASSSTAPIEDYTVVVPEWKVQVSLGGPTVVLNGTVQQVHHELLQINPDWDADYPHVDTTGRHGALEKRGIDVDGYFCFGRWRAANAMRIGEGVSYLRRVRGVPWHNAGPGTCSRVSCSWRSAIYWCNDQPHYQTIDSFGQIADGAQYLLDRCQSWATVAGQVFLRHQWNVIVRDDDC